MLLHRNTPEKREKILVLHRFLGALLLLTAFTGVAAADTITDTVTGTCGFYQGTRSNVVYSETFSGSGTFCTGFMAGGYVFQNSTVEVGDLVAFASHDTDAAPPAGYGVFFQFNDTLEIARQYLISSTIASTTATGSAIAFTDGSGSGTDDGTGDGSCHTAADVSLNGRIDYQEFSLPLTFGQPVTVVMKAAINCNLYSTTRFGDLGQSRAEGKFLEIFDANGNFLGPGIATAVPEPGSASLVVLFGVGFLVFVRRHAFGWARS